METVKRTYSKPDIGLVDFSLSSSIAANCLYKDGNQADGNTCTANDNG